MRKTLYDLLEVSQTASQEAILSSYQRLSARVVGLEADAENVHKALNEAFSVLSDPARRLRYDQTLARADGSSDVANSDGNGAPFKKLLFTCLLIGICAFSYNKYARDKEIALVEKERAHVAEFLAAKQRAEQAAEKAEQLAAKEMRAEQQRQERQQQYEMDVARQQGAQISQANAYAEERARKESESRLRQQEEARRQQQNEAQRRLAKDQAQLRQLEYENARYRRFSVN